MKIVCPSAQLKACHCLSLPNASPLCALYCIHAAKIIRLPHPRAHRLPHADMSHVACSELTEEDVRTAIKNSAGVKGTLMLPDAPFELLVRRALSRLLAPALQCKEFVHSELLRIAGQCAPPDIARFPALQVRMLSSTCMPCP